MYNINYELIPSYPRCLPTVSRAFNNVINSNYGNIMTPRLIRVLINLLPNDKLLTFYL